LLFRSVNEEVRVTFSATLDRTVQLYRANLGLLLVLSAIGAVPQLPFALAIDPDGQQPPRLHFSAGIVVLGLIAGLFVVFTSGALARAALAIHAGAPIDFREACRASLSRMPTLLVAAVLTVLASGAAMLLLVVPGFYVLLGFSFSYLVVMEEGMGAWAALKRSWALARNLRWRVFGLLVVWGLLQLVLAYAVSGGLGLFGLAAVGKVGKQLAGLLIAPCYSLALCLTYFAARADKEGHDLELEARRLAGGGAPPAGR
jgi:hypothetical protein